MTRIIIFDIRYNVLNALSLNLYSIFSYFFFPDGNFMLISSFSRAIYYSNIKYSKRLIVVKNFLDR